MLIVGCGALMPDPSIGGVGIRQFRGRSSFTPAWLQQRPGKETHSMFRLHNNRLFFFACFLKNKLMIFFFLWIKICPWFKSHWLVEKQLKYSQTHCPKILKEKTIHYICVGNHCTGLKRFLHVFKISYQQYQQ